MRKLKATTVALCLAELAHDTEHMSEGRQEAFATMLATLSKLYRDDSTHKAVLIIADEEGQTIVRINADEYETHGLLHTALPFHDELVKMSGHFGVLQ